MGSAFAPLIADDARLAGKSQNRPCAIWRDQIVHAFGKRSVLRIAASLPFLRRKAGNSHGLKDTRQIKAVFARAIERDIVASICMAHDAGGRIIPKHIANPPVSILAAIAADDHS